MDMTMLLNIHWLLSGLVTISAALRILDGIDCTQTGLNCSTQVTDTCSDEGWVVPYHAAPSSPEWGAGWTVDLGDRGHLLPLLTVTWSPKLDASLMSTLQGTEVHVLDQTSTQSLCVRFLFYEGIKTMTDSEHGAWTFSVDKVVVEPGRSYILSVHNLPKSENSRTETIVIPGCKNAKIQRARVCVENGSLWDPHVTGAVLVEGDRMLVVVTFEAGEFSELYQVSILSPGLQDAHNVSRENGTSLNVTFELDMWQLSQCEVIFEIQPFFIGCKNECAPRTSTFNYCHHYSRQPFYRRSLIIKAALGVVMTTGFLCLLLRAGNRRGPNSRSTFSDSVISHSTAPTGDLGAHQVTERRRVLVIYSLDHPLYKNVVLKLCAFLVAKCGTEVVLDLLDSARLGVLGRVQWLDWQREQIDRTAGGKILILCSRGVRAKWRAMCGGEPVALREDALSPTGDMLTPALALFVPRLVRSPSLRTYVVAYFEDVCSEEDVPPPFNVTVKYKLMRHFEEVFFRILDVEKQGPGRVNYVEGVTEDEYFHCPSGRALRDATAAFHAHQREHPDWFEEELVKDSDGEDEAYATGSEPAESGSADSLSELHTGSRMDHVTWQLDHVTVSHAVSPWTQ